MSLWDHIGARNLIALSRRKTLEAMGEEARQRLAADDGPAADRVLDAMSAKRAEWDDGWGS